MKNCYSNEPDILMLVALLKAHGVHRAVVSPGSTNISFAASLLYDPDFTVYSCVDERSAAYMACGLAAETGDPVVISCTGATAARNYVSALTEAYYRKLPVITVTSSQYFGRVGHHIPQVTDRTDPMPDICVKSVQIPIARSEEDRWSNNVKINDALLEAVRHGGGPVHINIETAFSKVFDVTQLPEVRIIRRITARDSFPALPDGRILIFVGAHARFGSELTEQVERFCARHNAVVVCDHTSNYKGNHRVLGGFVERQVGYDPKCRHADLIIHLGEVSGSYYSFPAAPVWRVNPDGEIRDTFKRLAFVFEMDELSFFAHYSRQGEERIGRTYFDEWKEEEQRILASLQELPFSNAWIAQQTAHRLPEGSVLHLGILNSLRMWNLFEVPESVHGYSNVGGFGIDGCISSLIGASFADPEQLYFLVVGDLATFYDLNSLGNRHIGSNIRILVINNGTGFEMRHSGNRGDVFGETADILFAASGHYGNQSHDLLRSYSQNLGFEYLSASDKEEYLSNLPRFVSGEKLEKPILFEVFLQVGDEYDVYEYIRNVISSPSSSAKKAIKHLIGNKGVQFLKGLKG